MVSKVKEVWESGRNNGQIVADRRKERKNMQ